MSQSPNNDTPLRKLLPHLQHLLALVSGPSLDALRGTWRFTLRNLCLPIPAILYILAPVAVFVGYILAIVTAPYRLGLWFAEIVHPVYIFCGVACLTGAAIGLSGRIISGLVIRSLMSPPPPPSAEEDEEEEFEGELSEEDEKVDSRVDVKGKGKARDIRSVKEEEDDDDDEISLGFEYDQSDDGQRSTTSQSTVKLEDDDQHPSGGH